MSFIQQQRVLLPNPDKLEPPAAKLINKWLRQHVELEYVMDAADKPERISAPDGKHDDYCDSCVIALHASLTMLPGSATFGTTQLTPAARRNKDMTASFQNNQSLFTTKQRNIKLNKHKMRAL